MSARAHQGTLDPPALAPVPGERQRRRLIPWLLTVAVLLAGAGAGLAMSDPFSAGGTSQSGVSGSTDPTSVYTVQRGTISSQIPVTASLGYAGSYSLVNQAAGTLTAVPAAGQVVRQGQVLYQVSGAPVVLLYGPTPAYRTLSSGLTGTDVAELNADLVSLGDATRAEIPAGSDTFTSATATALEKLQVGTWPDPERDADPGPSRVRSEHVPGDYGFGDSRREGAGRAADHGGHLDHP